MKDIDWQREVVLANRDMVVDTLKAGGSQENHTRTSRPPAALPKKKDRPYARPEVAKKEKFPEWMSDPKLLPLKPPGR